ncbi:MAG: stage III sporulation protein AE [Lachnospiraceae bacterium]|nr:stage III sporulation protein AE [Lachnospiraceae bacterium]
MKHRGWICLLFYLVLFFFFWGLPAYASEEKEYGRGSLVAESEKEEEWAYVDKWLSSMELDELDRGMEELFPQFHIDLEESLRMIMEGRIGEAGRELLGQIAEILKGELSNFRKIFLYILILGVMSSLFSGFSDLFAGQQIAQAGFYFLYLFLSAILVRVFWIMSQTAQTTISEIVLFVKLFIPTYFTAVGTAQGTVTAVCYYQLMLVIAYLVESFLSGVLLPFVYSYVLLAILNGIWAEEKLSLLLDFLKKVIGAALKISMGAVTGFSLVQSVVVPVADRLKISALRKAAASIPGIGGVVEGVTELVLGSAVLIKNSMGVLFLLLLAVSALIPLIKLLLIAGTVKLGAAIAGIVSDKRISGCTDRVGEGFFLLFRCVSTALLLFMIVIAVVAYTVPSW